MGCEGSSRGRQRRSLLLLRVIALAAVFVSAPRAPAKAGALPGSPVRAGRVTVRVAGRAFVVDLVRARLSDVRVRVGLGGGRVGGTEGLAAMATRYGAHAAINGSFFDAYARGPVKKPGQMLIVGGQDVHVGSVGTLIGFTDGGEARMERASRVIAERGSWGVPPKPDPNDDFWNRVDEALGAGPRLVRDGRVALDAAAEGFRSPKILTASAARSAVGVTEDGWILLATTTATVSQLARVMVALHARDAMNLDGGASSGLWVCGKYLRRPGRAVGNALLLLPRAP